eukprot:7490017-Alexandrium_andersonii.AAC.1
MHDQLAIAGAVVQRMLEAVDGRIALVNEAGWPTEQEAGGTVEQDPASLRRCRCSMVLARPWRSPRARAVSIEHH